MTFLCLRVYALRNTAKSKVHPTTGHEGPEREANSTLSLTSALDGVKWTMPRPRRFIPRGKRPGTHRTGGWVGPRAGLVIRGKSVLNTIRCGGGEGAKPEVFGALVKQLSGIPVTDNGSNIRDYCLGAVRIVAGTILPLHT